MAEISRIGSTSANGSSVTIPAGHQSGDLLLMFGFRDGSTGNITLPAGWTSLGTNGTNSCSEILGYKIAASSSETSGTWSSATDLICIVYRNVHATPVGTPVPSSAASTTVTYAALSPLAGTRSVVVGFAGHRATDTTIETPPSGMTLVINQLDATAESAAHELVATGLLGWQSTDVSVGGTSSGWQSYVVEIIPLASTYNNLNNYKFVKTGSGISATEKIR